MSFFPAQGRDDKRLRAGMTKSGFLVEFCMAQGRDDKIPVLVEFCMAQGRDDEKYFFL